MVPSFADNFLGATDVVEVFLYFSLVMPATFWAVVVFPVVNKRHIEDKILSLN